MVVPMVIHIIMITLHTEYNVAVFITNQMTADPGGNISTTACD